jgi:trehalose/maltose hydrolase-like predicted phosphorylase
LKLPFENQRIQKEILLPLLPTEEDFSPHNAEHKELKRSDPEYKTHKQTSTVYTSSSTSQQQQLPIIQNSNTAEEDNFRIDLNENSSKSSSVKSNIKNNNNNNNNTSNNKTIIIDNHRNSSQESNSYNSNLNSRNNQDNNNYYDKVLLEPQELYRKRLPKVVISISASASVSDSNGKKLNLSVANVLASNPKTPPNTYDEYKEDDVILDPFFLDVPKIKSRIKRTTLSSAK